MLFEAYLKQSFIMIMLCSGIPLFISSIAGLTLAVLQAATQIQEQSITHLAKFLTICAVFAVMAPWCLSELVQFIQQVLSSMAMLGRLAS